MVSEGKVKLSDKRGNDQADAAADLGATKSRAKVQAFGSMYSRRQQEDRTFVCRVQKIIVGLKEEEKKQREEMARRKDPMDVEAEKGIVVPSQLSYYIAPPGNKAGYSPPVGTGEAHAGNESLITKLPMHDLHPVWYSDAADGLYLRKVQAFLGLLGTRRKMFVEVLHGLNLLYFIQVILKAMRRLRCSNRRSSNGN